MVCTKAWPVPTSMSPWWPRARVSTAIAPTDTALLPPACTERLHPLTNRSSKKCVGRVGQLPHNQHVRDTSALRAAHCINGWGARTAALPLSAFEANTAPLRFPPRTRRRHDRRATARRNSAAKLLGSELHRLDGVAPASAARRRSTVLRHPRSCMWAIVSADTPSRRS